MVCASARRARAWRCGWLSSWPRSSCGSASDATAQTPYMPYYGKNLVRYDRFDWQIYKTEHFEIYYYPSIEQHLERVAGYAESAYQQISAELKHDLAFKVPLIIFKTHSEFEQQNVIPGRGAGRRRRVRRAVPRPDAAARSTSRRTCSTGSSSTSSRTSSSSTSSRSRSSGETVAAVGGGRPVGLHDRHLAAHRPHDGPRRGHRRHHPEDERAWRATGRRRTRGSSTTSATRRSSSSSRSGARKACGSSSSRCARASWAAARAPTWRRSSCRARSSTSSSTGTSRPASSRSATRKRRPTTGGTSRRSPRSRRSTAPSRSSRRPSGDLLAVVTLNRSDREIDIVLISAKDGKVIRNLTPGFDQGMGFDYIVTPGGRWITIPWLAWSPAGDRLAYVVRREKGKALVIQNVLTQEDREAHRPEDASTSPNRRRSRPTARRWRSRPCRTAGPTSSPSTWPRKR